MKGESCLVEIYLYNNMNSEQHVSISREIFYSIISQLQLLRWLSCSLMFTRQVLFQKENKFFLSM